jgi:beta-glucosidase
MTKGIEKNIIMEDKMKRLQFKSKVKPLAMGALATTLCISLTMSGILSVSNKAFAEEESSATSKSTATKYYTDFNSYEEEQEAGKALNEEIADEGDVLLKNKDNMLPFASSVKKLSVFGVRSVSLQVGGSGSGASSSDGSSTVAESLTSAGFEVNTKLQSYYEDVANKSTANELLEVGTSGLKSIEGSFALYDDAALIVISRSGQEFSDCTTANVTGHSDKTDHYLMFNDNEKELVEYVKGKFKKIVLVINSPSAMELADYEYDDAIGGIIWVGLTGVSGIMSLGKILNGEVNPSGKTVDVYAANFKTDPTWQNFNDNSQAGGVTTVTKYSYDDNGDPIIDTETGKQATTAFKTKIETINSIEYEEGIYYGYRWYETAYAEKVLTNTKVGYNSTKGTIPTGKNSYGEDYDEYYNLSTGVVYPFGYGLSYTTFDWEVVTSETKNNLDVQKGKNIEVTIKVTNKGSVAGKDVVQVYNSPKYYTNGIEKSVVSLVDYQKTDLLQPGESQLLTFSIDPQDLASFDYNDANGNGFQGYELEEGTGTLSFRSDSHHQKAYVEYTVKGGSADDYQNVKSGNKTLKAAGTTAGATGLCFDTDSTTGNKIEALFSQGDVYDTSGGYVTIDGKSVTVKADGSVISYTSRADLAGTFPTTPKDSDVLFSDAVVNYISSQEYTYSYDDKDSDPWYKTADDCTGWTQATVEQVAARVGGKTATQLYEMSGVDLYEKNADGEYVMTQAWVDFLNQLSYEELYSLVSTGNHTNAGVDAIGKPSASDQDGPAQLGSTGVSWLSEVNIASTWNVELAEKQGIFVGNDSLYIGVDGWYGPAMDIHRNPLAGRNFEYYSSDGIQGGKIAAAVVRGAVSKGVHVYIKHLAMNDQETNRYNVCTFATEQAMREIYFKCFELAIKEGNANGTMSAFNRIGINTAANYAVYHQLLQDEWGFFGSNVTDMYDTDGTSFYPSASGNTLVRSGIFPLGSYRTAGRKPDGEWSESENCVMVATSATDSTLVKSYTQWYAVRTTAAQVLKVAADSNLMKNGVDTTAFVSLPLSGEASSKLSNVSIAADETKLGATTVKYELSDGSLPDGVTLSEDGSLSGTPSTAGVYRFTVLMTADGWITASQTFTMNVAECTKFDLSSTTVAQGANYSANITSDVLKTEDDEGEYASISYSVVGDLPAGLTFDSEKGTISGTVAEAGTYTITIKATCTYPSSNNNQGGGFGGGGGGEGSDMGDMGDMPSDGGGDMGGGGMPDGGGMGMGGSSSADTFVRTFTLTVTASDNAVTTPVTTVDPANGIEFRVNNGNLEWKYKDADSNSWATAVAISELATTSADSSSSSSSSGCGSTLADTSIAIVMGVLALGGVAIAIKASKRKDSDK